MGASFNLGTGKIRPGVYHRYENWGGGQIASARDGVCAIALTAGWGPLSQIVVAEGEREIRTAFGEGAGVEVARKAFQGGAQKLLLIRVGTGGEKGAISLQGGAGGAERVRMVCAYAGARALSATLRDSLVSIRLREFVLYAGTTELLRVSFAKGDMEASALVEAVNALENAPVVAELVAEGALSDVQQKPFEGGCNPDVSDEAYERAFELLEAERWNVLLVDSAEAEIHDLAAAFMIRAASMGKLGMLVVGANVSVPYATRKARASALDSKHVVFVINGGYDGSGNLVDGAEIAALVGGLAASTPSSASLTHCPAPGISRLAGALTNAQIEECIEGGALALTQSASGTVWIEAGVNTLVTLLEDEDAGWKKIRRAKTRFELIERVRESVDSIVGQINNDGNGRATVIAIAQGVINRMVSEGKLLGGSAAEDPERPAQGDSAWFTLSVDDLDSMERVYLTYGFRFSA